MREREREGKGSVVFWGPGTLWKICLCLATHRKGTGRKGCLLCWLGSFVAARQVATEPLPPPPPPAKRGREGREGRRLEGRPMDTEVNWPASRFTLASLTFQSVYLYLLQVDGWTGGRAVCTPAPATPLNTHVLPLFSSLYSHTHTKQNEPFDACTFSLFLVCIQNLKVPKEKDSLFTYPSLSKLNFIIKNWTRKIFFFPKLVRSPQKLQLMGGRRDWAVAGTQGVELSQ